MMIVIYVIIISLGLRMNGECLLKEWMSGIIDRLREVDITSVSYEVDTSYLMKIRLSDKHEFIINLNDVEIMNYDDLILGNAGINGDYAMSGYIGLQTTNMNMQVLSLYISESPIDFWSNSYDVVADIKQCAILSTPDPATTLTPTVQQTTLRPSAFPTSTTSEPSTNPTIPDTQTSESPSDNPSQNPSQTHRPTIYPSASPETSQPSRSPSEYEQTYASTELWTVSPTDLPTKIPTIEPTLSPLPTQIPSRSPLQPAFTHRPSNRPTTSPTTILEATTEAATATATGTPSVADHEAAQDLTDSSKDWKGGR